MASFLKRLVESDGSSPQGLTERRGGRFHARPRGRFFRVADGHIAEMWEDYEAQGMRQQLTRPGG